MRKTELKEQKLATICAIYLLRGNNIVIQAWMQDFRDGYGKLMLRRSGYGVAFCSVCLGVVGSVRNQDGFA